MEISKIREMPRFFNAVEHGNCHESLLRAFHIVDKVKHLLKLGTPTEVVLEIIAEIEAYENQNRVL